MKKVAIIIAILGCLPAAAQQFKEVKKVVTAPQKNETYFGRIVAIEKNNAIVGTWVNNYSHSGFAHVYEWDSLKGWSFVQRIQPSDTTKRDLFGFSVAFSGEHAIIGSPYRYAGPKIGLTSLDSGSVYFFKRTKSGSWVQTQKIWEPVPPIRSSYFGCSVAISGEYAIVGYKGDDTDAAGRNKISRSGSVYVYKRDEAGVWTQVQKVCAGDRLLYGVFGSSVSMSGDCFLVGASDREKSDFAIEASSLNSVYVFKQTEDGRWSQVQKIQSPAWAIDRFDAFGNSLSISDDQAIIGAEYANNIAGVAYIFTKGADGRFIQKQKIVPDDEIPYSAFGGGVAISGRYAAITAALQYNRAGSTYVFERTDSGHWNQIQKLVASDSSVDAKFGFSVGLYENRMVVGAIWDRKNELGVNSGKVFAGSAYFFNQDLPKKESEPKKCLTSDINYSVPNVITPNGDGSNDSFRIVDLKDSTAVTIFNRYGSPVFKTDSYQNDWCGEGLSTGVYYYFIRKRKEECTYESKVG